MSEKPDWNINPEIQSKFESKQISYDEARQMTSPKDDLAELLERVPEGWDWEMFTENDSADGGKRVYFDMKEPNGSRRLQDPIVYRSISGYGKTPAEAVAVALAKL